MIELESSLRRLGADHVDLYQIHRWDPTTSDEETLSALTDLQRAGKIHYHPLAAEAIDDALFPQHEQMQSYHFEN